MADDSNRGVQLNEKQIVFVLMAAGVICGVVFLFGVMVGRNVQLSHGAPAETALVSPPQVVSDPQPAVDPAAVKPASTAGDEYSYPKRLSQPDGQAEPLKPGSANANANAGGPPEVPDEGAVPPAPAPAAAKPQEPPAKPASPPAKMQDAGTKPAAAAPKTPDAAAKTQDASTKPAADAGATPWTVQVIATKKKAEADALVKKLKGKGYDARTVAPDAGDKTGVYRVKIGSFTSKTEAEAVAARLSGEGPYKLWVTR